MKAAGFSTGDHRRMVPADGGRACIRGIRIFVALILNLLTNGTTKEETLDTQASSRDLTSTRLRNDADGREGLSTGARRVAP